MDKVIKDTIHLLGTDLYYEIYGEGIPILMIHGWGVNHYIMSNCMEPILHDNSHRYKRIYIDLPGMGRSKPSYTRASYVILDKAGHNLQIEQTELFNHLVLEWLNRINHEIQ